MQDTEQAGGITGEKGLTLSKDRFMYKFRDVRNKYRTESLFLENYSYWALDPAVYQPLYSIREYDRVLDPNHVFYEYFPDHVVPSLRKLYLEMQDPLEFEFAHKYFESDRHWKAVCSCKWFLPHIQEWREALDQKIQSQNIKRIMAIADSSSPSALSASRWLAEKGYGTKATKGRPSKQEVANKVAADAKIEEMLKEDAERVGLA